VLYVPGSASCALESLTGQELKQGDMTEGMGKVRQGKFRDPNELICGSRILFGGLPIRVSALRMQSESNKVQGHLLCELQRTEGLNELYYRAKEVGNDGDPAAACKDCKV